MNAGLETSQTLDNAGIRTLSTPCRFQMPELPRFFAALMAVVIAFATAASAQDQPPAAEFWVSPAGCDTNPGSISQPMASLAMAQRKTRDMRRVTTNTLSAPVRIILRGGTYRLNSPLLFRFEDAGTETSPTLIEAAPGESPVLSGGVPVTGWRKAQDVSGLPKAAQGNVWMADAPTTGGRVLKIRQLWIDDAKAMRARNPNAGTLDRLLEWDRPKQEAWISPATLLGVREPAQLEMVFHQQWEIAICRVKSIQTDGGRACLKFHSPESQIQFEHPWPQPVMSVTNGNGPFYLVNAIEFLDQPGEWYQEEPGGWIYYWPRPGEDLTKANVTAPVLETLVQVSGSLDQPVTHIRFKGISFQHTAWMRPAQYGHVPLQAGMFMLEAYKLKPHSTPYHRGLDNQAWLGRAPGAVSVSGAGHLKFERCRFEHLAFSGLDFISGTHDDTIEGCVFSDVGGNGMQMGKFSDMGIETHRPYTPSDEREIATRERIVNNLVTGCGTEDWGCAGIIAGWVRQTAIEHNEICQLPYTGISLGWGWNKRTNCMSGNRIVGNHIHHVAQVMGDTAGIYTLSPQPGSLVAENSVHSITMNPYVFDPEHWFYLYTDEGSSWITVRDNWCPAERFLKNANGPGCEWTNNGPKVSETIKNAAGLEPAFRDLLSGKPR
jgi:hypothetical protein